MSSLMLHAQNRYEIWTDGVYNRVVEFIEADQEVIDAFVHLREEVGLDALPDSPTYLAAKARLADARCALPFWLRAVLR